METQSENQRFGVPQNSPETRLWWNTNTTSTHTVTHWRGTRSFLERFTLFFYFLRLLDTFVWQVCVLGWTDTFFFRSQSCIQTARNSMCSYRKVFLWRCLKMSSSQLKKFTENSLSDRDAHFRLKNRLWTILKITILHQMRPCSGGYSGIIVNYYLTTETNQVPAVYSFETWCHLTHQLSGWCLHIYSSTCFSSVVIAASKPKLFLKDCQ